MGDNTQNSYSFMKPIGFNRENHPTLNQIYDLAELKIQGSILHLLGPDPNDNKK